MKFDVIKKCRYDLELQAVFNALENICNAKGLNVEDYLAITGTEFNPLYVETYTYKADGELCSIIFVQLVEEDRLRLVEYDCEKGTLKAITDWYATADTYDSIVGAVILYKDLVNDVGDLYFGGTFVKDIVGCHLLDLQQIGSCIFIPFGEDENIKGVYAYTNHVFSETYMGIPTKEKPLPKDEAPMYRKIESSVDFLNWYDTVVNRMYNFGLLDNVSSKQVINLCANLLSQLCKFGIR